MTAHKSDQADLRSRYPLFLEIGLAVSLALVIALFTIPLQDESTFEIVTDQQEVIAVEEIEQTRQIERPPTPPRPLPPIAVADDIELDDAPIDLDIRMDFDAPAELPPPPPPPTAPPEPEPEPEPEEPEIFVVVEEMPELIGGIASIQARIKYPELAVQAGIEGTVYVQFVIDEEGRVTDPVVLRGIGGGCDEAAIEAVRTARFTPGRQRGKPVRVQFSLPVRFELK